MCTDLVELAGRQFSPRALTKAEQKLFEAVQRGRTMSCGPPTKPVPECLIHADCLQWLCTNEDARKLVTHRGIRARDVVIDGVLDLDDAQVPFPFRATNCVFNNDIRFERARLRSLALIGCSVKNIQAAGVVIEGEAELNEGFTADGEVNFVAANITGALDFQGAMLRNPSGITLYANRARIGGSLYLRRNFRSTGEINITRTTIGSNLDCSGAHLFNPRGQAINASSTEISGNIFLRNTYVAGALNILAARVHGFVACDGARFTHFQREESAACPVRSNSKFEGRAFIAKSAKIEGDVSLIRGFRAIGSLDFERADIGGNLECTDAELRAKTGAILDLRQASVTAFWDDRKSWPSKGKLRLDGFTYKRIFEDDPSPRPDHRIEWLRLQPTDDFFPHPYEQLFATAKSMGHGAQARTVMIEKNKAYARYIRQRFKSKSGHRFYPFARVFRQEWWWYNCFGNLIGYGYKPWRAFGWSVLAIILGALIFGAGYDHDLMSPTKEGAYHKELPNSVPSDDRKSLSYDYPKFNKWAYSIESFIPLVKFDQSANWTPNANHGAMELFSIPLKLGSILRVYLWGHIVLGWILTSLWVGAITGLLKT